MKSCLPIYILPSTQVLSPGFISFLCIFPEFMYVQAKCILFAPFLCTLFFYLLPSPQSKTNSISMETSLNIFYSFIVLQFIIVP